MRRLDRIKVLSVGLNILTDQQLKNIINWEGSMLLDGNIYNKTLGLC
jgi:hypothetical protein